jgi:hypothetical protein
MQNYVYVARSADPWSDGEVYVFDTEENAEAFAETRADDYTITEEPVLDASFVNEAREATKESA